MSPTATPAFDPAAALVAADRATGHQADPQTLTGAVKAASSTAEAVTNAQAAVHFGSVVREYDSLRSMQASSQATAWQGMTATEQESLRAIGYKPPNLDALPHTGAGGQHGGAWSWLASGWHDLTSVAEGAYHSVAEGVHDVLSVAGAPVRFAQHVWRAAQYKDTEYAIKHGIKFTPKSSAFQAGSAHEIGTGGSWLSVFSPSAWAQAWNATTTGNRTLTPALSRELNAKYGRSNVQLAIRVVATGATAVVKSASKKQRPALVRSLQDAGFQELLTQVQNSRMSFGRSIVGQRYLTQHPVAGKVLSGALDATYDIASTPLRVVGKAAEGARIVRYGITSDRLGAYVAGDADAMEQVVRQPGVQRYISQVGKYLANGDYGILGRFDPQLDAVATALRSEGIDSADKFQEWLVGQGGMGAMLAGKAARLSHGVAIVPHLSWLGWGKAAIKDALQTGIDKLADGDVQNLGSVALGDEDVAGQSDTLRSLLDAGGAGKTSGRIPAVSNLARVVRRLTTLIPDRPYLDIGQYTGDVGSGADVTNLRRFLQGFLPARRVDDVVNVFLDSDEGTRYRIVTALRHQMLQAFGLYDNPDGLAAADKLLDALGDLERKQAYSVGDLDVLAGDDELPTHSAVLENQLSTRVALPMPNQVRQAVRETGVLGSLNLNPVTWATRFMYYWRTLLLDRPGFAVRFSLTENIQRLLRSGPAKFLGSFLANGAARTRDDADIVAEVDRLIGSGDIAATDRDAEIAGRKALAIKPVMPYHPTHRLLSMLGDKVPEGMRPYVDDPEKFYGAVLGATTRKWVRAAQAGGVKALGLSTYIEAATHLYTHQPVADAFQDLIAAGHGSEGFMFTPGGVAKAVRDNLDVSVARFRQAGHYSTAGVSDPLYGVRWQFALDQVATSKLGRAVLESIDKSARTQERAVLRVLTDYDFADTKARFARATRLPGGRTVGVDATQAEADRAFARTVVKHVNSLVRAGDPKDGTVLHDLVDEMLATGRGPSSDSLDAAAATGVPQQVYGQDILPVSKTQDLFNKSFEALVGKPANWLARQPHFIQAYAEALQQTRPYAEMIAGEGANAEKLASDLATQRAVEAVIPYIHNPTLRTQFEDSHRILFPFLFAQRQFLQRWARTIADSPTAVRKLQLTMNGLRSVGFVKKATTGETFFYYPGSQYVQELVTGVLSKLGILASVPMVVPFTGQVQYLMPGLSNPVTPSVGPFAAVSMKELSSLLPELAPATRSILGQGATTPMWQQFTPTILNRVWEALGPNQAGSELASTTMQAIKYLDAAGYTLPSNASPGEVEQFVSRVQNWARSLLLVRAALGFVLPATPEATLDPRGLDSRLRQLLKELPYDTAVAEFVREHPTATAYTVSESDNNVDGTTPATKASLQWLDQHQDFAKAHPLAAAWFIPRSSGTFTPRAYRQQIALGMRTPKTGTTFMDDVIMARASNAYYTTLTRFEKAYTSTTSSAQHQQLSHWWDGWKAQFFAQNPIFGNYIASSAGHVKRLQVIEDVSKAITTPQAPKGPMVDQMRTVVEQYEAFVDAYTATAGLYTTGLTAQRKALKQEMVTWLAAYSNRHPQVTDFVNTVIRPEVDEAK